MSESDKNSIKLEEENEQDPPEGHDEDNDIEQDNDQNEDEQAAKRKSGEDGKEDEIASKEAINFSEPNVDSRVQISYSSIKQNPSVVPSTKSEIDLLRKENLDIQQSIIDICQEIQFLE